MDIRNIRRPIVFAALIGATCSNALATEPLERRDTQSQSSTSTSVAASPWISSTIPEPVRARLTASHQLAAQRLAERAPCRNLFSDLGAKGNDALASTLYYPASAAQEKQVCRGAWGYTTVGSAPTFLCRRFSRLSERRAALVLIHEALHRAGMGEWPQDPDALASSTINDLVADACGL